MHKHVHSEMVDLHLLLKEANQWLLPLNFFLFSTYLFMKNIKTVSDQSFWYEHTQLGQTEEDILVEGKMLKSSL